MLSNHNGISGAFTAHFHTQKLRLLPLPWRPEHGTACMAGWAGVVVMLPPDWLHSCFQELLLASSCYPPIISARATLSSERCPPRARPGMTVLSCHFLEHVWLSPVLWINLCFCPKALSDWKSPELHPLKYLFSLERVCSPLYFMYLFFEEILNTSIMSSLGFRSQTVPALRKLPCQVKQRSARRTTHNRLGR